MREIIILFITAILDRSTPFVSTVNELLVTRRIRKYRRDVADLANELEREEHYGDGTPISALRRLANTIGGESHRSMELRLKLNAAKRIAIAYGGESERNVVHSLDLPRPPTKGREPPRTIG